MIQITQRNRVAMPKNYINLICDVKVMQNAILAWVFIHNFSEHCQYDAAYIKHICAHFFFFYEIEGIEINCINYEVCSNIQFHLSARDCALYESNVALYNRVWCW